MAETTDKDKLRSIPITDTQSYPLESFLIPAHYINDLSYVMIPHGLIVDRAEKLAYEIIRDLTGPLVMLCVLKGAYQFYSDLIDKIQSLNCVYKHKSLQLDIDFIRMKSYVDDSSTGDVKVVGHEDFTRVKGKHVLIVEDIVDTGATILKLNSHISKFQPASVKVATLLLKRNPARTIEYQPDFVGFDIPDKFIVGYGLDYNEYFRDLPHICVINDAGKVKYSSSKS
ncbi:hypothetical protein LOD99_6479 [Oopsacas minuta]|uniref:Hypoxanthine phosphoribosyltransferase n=1 Tax=Oopsacas minuta TaxID=111878 RepID=A0AAV7JMM3_9METZ|nr:hypothetical protein LOD99_6479 [Oopsacas minuta]